MRDILLAVEGVLRGCACGLGLLLANHSTQATPNVSARSLTAAPNPVTLRWSRRLPHAVAGAADFVYYPAYCNTPGFRNNEIPQDVTLPPVASYMQRLSTDSSFVYSCESSIV